MEVIYDGEGEDVTNGEASGEVTVGVGVNNKSGLFSCPYRILDYFLTSCLHS